MSNFFISLEKFFDDTVTLTKTNMLTKKEKIKKTKN